MCEEEGVSTELRTDRSGGIMKGTSPSAGVVRKGEVGSLEEIRRSAQRIQNAHPAGRQLRILWKMGL